MSNHAGGKHKDPAAVSLGKRGGRIGGKKKVPKGFSVMDPEKRAQIARDAAKKRWAKWREAREKEGEK